jgi:hypothetical protein
MGFEAHRLVLLYIDEQLPVQDEEELVGVVVLVPVELSLDDAEADHGVIDHRQRLVEPGLMLSRLPGDVDQREMPELDVELDVVVVTHFLSRPPVESNQQRAFVPRP